MENLLIIMFIIILIFAIVFIKIKRDSTEGKREASDIMKSIENKNTASENQVEKSKSASQDSSTVTSNMTRKVEEKAFPSENNAAISTTESRIDDPQEAAFRKAQEENDMQSMIAFAIDGFYVREETLSKYAEIILHHEYDTLRNESDPDHTPESFLLKLEMCNLEYKYHDERRDGQRMLRTIADKAFLCTEYGYYDDAIKLGKFHDSSFWLAPMGWRGDMEETIRENIRTQKKISQKKASGVFDSTSKERATQKAHKQIDATNKKQAIASEASASQEEDKTTDVDSIMEREPHTSHDPINFDSDPESWNIFDIHLRGFMYGWDYMVASAAYMEYADIESVTTLAIAEMANWPEEELIKSYRKSQKTINDFEQLSTERGQLAIGGISRTLKTPVKIIWFNQSNTIRFQMKVHDESIWRNYVDNVVRRSFGT